MIIPQCAEAFGAGVLVHFAWDFLLLAVGLMFGIKFKHRHKHKHPVDTRADTEQTCIRVPLLHTGEMCGFTWKAHPWSECNVFYRTGRHPPNPARRRAAAYVEAIG